jgi:hypothetical protein
MVKNVNQLNRIWDARLSSSVGQREMGIRRGPTKSSRSFGGEHGLIHWLDSTNDLIPANTSQKTCWHIGVG